MAGPGLAVIRSARPDVVLLDVNLPDLNGLDVAGRLAAESCSATVVLVSELDSAPSRAARGGRWVHPEERADSRFVESFDRVS